MAHATINADRSEEIMQTKLQTPQEVAKVSGWPLNRVRSLIKQQRLRHVRVGRTVLVPEGAIDEFISLNTVLPEGVTE